jgi:tetratricopeptide (TPR) repeat protein
MSDTSSAIRTVQAIVPEVEYLNRQANELAAAGQQEQARMFLDEALKVDPASACTWFNKGNCLDDMGHYAEAIACYNEAIRIDPGQAETWYNKGISLRKTGNIREAESCISPAVSLSLGIE